MRLLAFLFILLLPLQSFAAESGKIFNAESATLDNGLQIVVIPNHRAPVVTHMIWYKVGAGDEAAGKSGIAHFLEHLMFKGSEGLKSGEFSERIRAMGGNDNAFTGQDYTAYFQSISVDHLDTVMRMEAGRMRGMTLPEDQVNSEREVIMEERRQRTDNDPRAKFGEQLSAALFVNSRYGAPIIGWMHEIATLSRADAKGFYDKWYGPNNAILVVSGDVTLAQVVELAKKTYGTLPKITVPERNRLISPPMNSLAHVTLEHEAIHLPMVQIGFRAPSYHQNKDEALALQVLEEILGGGPTARLYKSLAVDQKIASSADLSYGADAWDDATIWMSATPAPGQELETIEKALKDELRKVVKDGVTEAELNDSKSRMQAEAVYARDSLAGPAMIFGYSLATGSTIDDVEYWPQNIAKVTAEQVHEVAKKYLDPDHPTEHPYVTGFLVPKQEEAVQPTPAEEPAQ